MNRKRERNYRARRLVPSSTRSRGVGALTFLVIGVMLVLFTLGMGLINRVTAEARWIRRIIISEKCTTYAEALVEEMLYHVRQTMNDESTPVGQMIKMGAVNYQQPLLYPTIPSQGKQPGDIEDTLLYKHILLDTGEEGKKQEVDLSPSAVQIAANISLVKVEKFTANIDYNPQPGTTQDPGEMKAIIKLKAMVTINKLTRKVTILKDIKRVNIAPPPPMDEWLLFVEKGRNTSPNAPNKDVGQMAIPKKFVKELKILNSDPFQQVSDSLKNLEGKIKEEIAKLLKRTEKEKKDNWRYKWSNRIYKGYPFCREKASHYFPTFTQYEAAMGFQHSTKLKGDKLYFLPGIVVINDRKRILLNGWYANRGMLVSRRSSINCTKFIQYPGSLASLVTLGKSNEIRLGNTPFRLGVFNPEADILTSKRTRLEGHLSAKNWIFGEPKSLDVDSELFEREKPLYHVTMSRQIILWQEGM